MKFSYLLQVTSKLSAWIYDKQQELPCDIKILASHDRYGIFQTSERDCIVSHRGTFSVDDLIHDAWADIFHTCAPNGYINAFTQSLLEYSHELSNHLLTFMKTNECKAPIIMTGHSLGGTMASIFHSEYPSIIITFGEPKSVCTFTNTTDKNYWRVIMGNTAGHHDPIPYFPNAKHIVHSSRAVIELHDDCNIFANQYAGVTVPISGSLADIFYHHIYQYTQYIDKCYNNL